MSKHGGVTRTAWHLRGPQPVVQRQPRHRLAAPEPVPLPVAVLLAVLFVLLGVLPAVQLFGEISPDPVVMPTAVEVTDPVSKVVPFSRQQVAVPPMKITNADGSTRPAQNADDIYAEMTKTN